MNIKKDNRIKIALDNIRVTVKKMVMIDALKKPWNRMPVIHISSWKRLLGLDTRP